jgi:glycosyltransferase involved in cell wall biosynthesis
VIAVLGRVSGWKGQDVLVRALGEEPLRGREDAIALVAGAPARGEERHRRELHALAARLGVSARLYDVGFQEDLELVYGAADVVAVPSKQPDPLPNAALEAFAAGCCVVAAAHGGLPEVVRDHETGRLVAPRDPAALAGVLAELAADPGQRARLAAAAALDVRERFARPRLLDEVQALYDRLLA